MQLIQCYKCGQFDPAWDYAHLCGPIKIKPQMNEYYIELQDAQGTGYGCTDIAGNEMYFEDLNEARLFAKSKLKDHIVMTRIIDVQTNDVVDFFET
jgi:hypothetical protein